MINKNNLVNKIIPTIIVMMSVFIIGLFFSWRHIAAKKKEAVITTGLSTNQEENFQKELGSAFKVFSLIHKGRKLLSQGNYDGAIVNFKQALSASKMSGEKGVSMECLADVYEKKRDYLLARDWMIKVRDNCPNEWALQPFVDRIQYLNYVLKGDYELAVQQASKAAEDYKLTGTAQTEGYIGRLNDLKAAKEYILNLKKK